jgi:antitoxin (DNA-binding transcriptional repressor) of toxin-antitoxin stability system
MLGLNSNDFTPQLIIDRPLVVMQKVNLKEAETRLAELIEKAARGEEIVIIRSDGSSFKILPMTVEEPFPKFGSAKGLVEMSDDFDEPLEEFEDYAP